LVRASAWNNGAHHASGAGYGLKVTPGDRDRHFRPEWRQIELAVPGEGTATVPLSESFWRRCTELRSAAVGRWLRRTGQAPWEDGAPPQFELVPLHGATFAVRDGATGSGPSGPSARRVPDDDVLGQPDAAVSDAPADPDVDPGVDVIGPLNPA
jgi:hypothetical protein